MKIVLSYPNGQRQDVLLADCPRVGDHVRLKGDRDEPSLVVEQILWLESNGIEPSVIACVRRYAAAQAMTIVVEA